jgi:hypothetical protein
MIKRHQSLVATAIALSLTALAGCTTLPSLLPGVTGSGASTPQAAGSLKVVVSAPARTTQAFDPSTIAIQVKLDFPYSGKGQPGTTLNVQSGVPAVFGNIAPGHGRLTVTAQDVTTNQVYDTQSQWIDILPGVQASASFTLTVGGSAATDVGLTFGANSVDFRTIPVSDGYNLDFNPPSTLGPQPINWTQQQFPYTLTVGAASTSVVFTHSGNQLMRQVGNQQSVPYPADSWYWIPAHATWVDSTASMQVSGLTFNKIRHFRWANTYVVTTATHSYTFDRWVGAFDGLIQEVMSENGNVVSTMVRAAGLPPQGPFFPPPPGGPFPGPGNPPGSGSASPAPQPSPGPSGAPATGSTPPQPVPPPSASPSAPPSPNPSGSPSGAPQPTPGTQGSPSAPPPTPAPTGSPSSPPQPSPTPAH